MESGHRNRAREGRGKSQRWIRVPCINALGDGGGREEAGLVQVVGHAHQVRRGTRVRIREQSGRQSVSRHRPGPALLSDAAPNSHRFCRALAIVFFLVVVFILLILLILLFVLFVLFILISAPNTILALFTLVLSSFARLVGVVFTLRALGGLGGGDGVLGSLPLRQVASSRQSHDPARAERVGGTCAFP